MFNNVGNKKIIVLNMFKKYFIQKNIVINVLKKPLFCNTEFIIIRA